MTEIERRLVHIAKASPNREVCGLIDSNGNVHEIRNVSSSNTSFIFDKREYYKALNAMKLTGAVVDVIYHSHIDACGDMSGADKQLMDKMKCTMAVVTNEGVRWYYYE